MKLHLSNPSGVNAFTGYGEGYVMVNRQRYEQQSGGAAGPHPDGLATCRLRPARGRRISPGSPSSSRKSCCSAPAPRLRFPRPELTRALIEARIGLEVMDIQAACRTYNILAAEERKVAAALLFS